MVSQDQFDLDAALDDETTPAGLRKWAESVRKENRKLADELAEFRSANRKGAVSSALRDLGVNEKVAAFYPADAEASGEAVAKWFKEYADVFGTPAKDNDEAGGAVGQQAPGHSPIAADVAAAMRLIQDSTPTSSGTPTLADRVAEIDRLPMRTADDRAKLDSFEKELQEMARQHQAAFVGSMQR